MNHKQAKTELDSALNKQQTISIQKLKRLLESMEFERITQSNRDLRRQNKKLRRRIERYKNMEGWK